MILKYEKYIATFFNLLFTFFASVLIARGLSLSDRGFYGEILYYSSLAAMIFCPPIFEYLSKFIDRQYDREDNTALRLNFLFLYILYPFFGIYKFYVATKKSDVNYISKNVNWESLRLGFKNDLKIILDKKIKNKDILGNKLCFLY